MNDKYKISREFLERLKEELRYREDKLKPEIQDKIKEARDQGDLSENAEYAAARELQSENESRINELIDIIDNHVIDEEDNSSNVGKFVTVVFDETGEEFSFKLVSSSLEANPMEDKISKESPLGKAVCLAGVGSKVEVKSANGAEFYVTVKSIRKPSDE